MKTIATGLRLKSNEWDASKECVFIHKGTPQRCRELSMIQNCISDMVLELKDVIIRLMTNEVYVTADMIVQNYKEVNFTKSFFLVMEERIRELKTNGQERTAANYQSALKMFKLFREDKDLAPNEITGVLMKKMEFYLKSRDNSLNTISFYMRILQAVYNYAVEKKWVAQDNSPFKGVFTGEEKTVKRAVEKEVALQLAKLDLGNDPALNLAKDLFMFSLYTCGMAFIDVAYLTKGNLKGNILEYKRHKTKQRIQISLPECGMEIVRRYADCMNETNYLFPVLYHPDRKKYSLYDSALRLHNQRLKRISEIMGLDTPLTSYVSRHTWATLAKLQGIPTYVISDAMGHTSEETTRIYLDSINNFVLDQANNQVVSLFHV